jgi:hypothetical protein
MINKEGIEAQISAINKRMEEITNKHMKALEKELTPYKKARENLLGNLMKVCLDSVIEEEVV